MLKECILKEQKEKRLLLLTKILAVNTIYVYMKFITFAKMKKIFQFYRKHLRWRQLIHCSVSVAEEIHPYIINGGVWTGFVIQDSSEPFKPAKVKGVWVKQFKMMVIQLFQCICHPGMAPRVRDWGGGVKANLTNSRRSMLRFDQLESVNVEV